MTCQVNNIIRKLNIDVKMNGGVLIETGSAIMHIDENHT